MMHLLEMVCVATITVREEMNEQVIWSTGMSIICNSTRTNIYWAWPEPVQAHCDDTGVWV